MLSFNLELNKNLNENKPQSYEEIPQNSKKEDKKKDYSDESKTESEYLKLLTNSTLDVSEFNLLNYFVYIFYVPVYFSGPTILFNSFTNQINKIFINESSLSKINSSINNKNEDDYNIKDPKNNNKINSILFKVTNPIDFKNKLIYFLRYIFVIICFEIFNRYIYVNLYLTNPKNFYLMQNEKFNYYSYSLFCFFLLIFIWFKFTVIWRTARIWAMFDDILTEENMNRCMYNNYCFEGFWRAWHRSFNVWLIRYIFIPLGGSSFKYLNVWIVFTFVALWHDLQLKLLLWGWFICFFMIPEIYIKRVFSNEMVNINFCLRYL